MKKVVCKNGQIIYKSKVLSILLMLQVIFHGKKICKITGDLFWFPSLALEQFSDREKRSDSCTYKNVMVMLEEKWGR